MNYRNLHSDEVTVLKQNGCHADDWDRIRVTRGFQPDRVRNVCFVGKNSLGIFDGTIELEEGESVPCGIYNSTLHDTIIEDNVFIASVQFLSRYRVQTGAVLRNVGTIAVTGGTAFGNGVEISVLNEGGGREVMMYDRLTVQIAAIMATCRHDERIVEQLRKMIGGYADEKRSEWGCVESGAAIYDCGVLKNIFVGEHARISNARHLEEVTLVGSREAPVKVGAGVIARNVIIQSGSLVDSGAVLDYCFVGQSVTIARQLSAEHSVFFANSEAMHGEAVSLFAGPYTVTHHKSTLLIAAMTSFLNVGSGTNQSNHMYKLGPLHQGVLERGAKTGSFSYMGWPMHIGPFTVILNKHGEQFDASDFPFSYIDEHDGRSVLTPGMNLFTVGTSRDNAKWRDRDRRNDPDRLDLIHFDLFNPWIISKVLKAMEIMKQLYESASKDQVYVHYKRLNIKRLMLKTCKRYYDMAVHIFMGNVLLERLKKIKHTDKSKKINKALKYDPDLLSEDWLDLGGMFLPTPAFEGLLDEIAAGTYRHPEELEKALRCIYDRYEEYVWAYAARLIEKRYEVSVDRWDEALLSRVLDAGKDNRIKLNNMIYRDAKKEFDPLSQIGYGLFGHAEEDFQAVRGALDDNKFVRSLENENREINAEVAEITADWPAASK